MKNEKDFSQILNFSNITSNFLFCKIDTF
uniref:Uncharacterized protein n=1 Tax=Lepeophtheirus salmonis TaxID=72036 RepID=A0A0K2T8D3_LEPSM